MEDRERTGEERENLVKEGVVRFLVLFHNKATIFPCASRTPSWENPKGCIELYRTKTKRLKIREEEKRKPTRTTTKEEEQRTKLLFLSEFEMPLFSGFSHLPVF